MNTKWPPLLLSALLAWQASAQSPSSPPPTVHSQSGQFIVSGSAEARYSPLARTLVTNRQWLAVEPALLVVSCERARQAVIRQLGITSPWRGRICISLYPAAGLEDSLTLTAERFRDDWNYRLVVPDVVERTRLMQGIVQAVLLEIANRQTGARPAELPSWLVIGLTEQLLAAAEAELLFPPPRKEVGGVQLDSTVTLHRQMDERAGLHARLRAHAPLTLQELSWPGESELDGALAPAYRTSAQAFVTELTRLRNGAACLHAFLQELPRHFNWQTAFLKAFRQHFGSLLDVEKWWTLHMAYLGGRDLLHTWPAADSWQKLHEAVRVPAQVRTASNELSSIEEVIPLQTIIRDWPHLQQSPVLRERMDQLELVRRRLTPELQPLAEAYQRVLMKFLNEQGTQETVRGRGPTVRPNFQRGIREAVRGLNRLDAQLQAARPKEVDRSTLPEAAAKPSGDPR